MEKSFISEHNLLLTQGNLSNYLFGKVDQVILIPKDKNKSLINYFTHIEFSTKHNIPKKIEPISKKPISISSDYKVGIFSGVLSIDEIKTIITYICAENEWKYQENNMQLDDIFETKKKFVPEYSPLGGRYNKYIPIESGLYGSNFIGNYYIQELFSKKTMLNNIVNDKIIKLIQDEITAVRLNYRLDKLPDRIGNIICKYKIDVLSSTPKNLGEFGIEYEFAFANYADKSKTYTLQILEEYDEIIYDNIINNNFDCSSFYVEPNQYITKIFIVDNTTGLTVFGYVQDNTQNSDYYSQIDLSHRVFTASRLTRTLHLENSDEDIYLDVPQALGEYGYFIEPYIIGKRTQQKKDEWFKEQKYIMMYEQNEQTKAKNDILSIINDKKLSWDLEEIWIIDPYLSVDDIIVTALRCEVKGVFVKCLCSYNAIHGNKETKDSNDYESFCKKRKERLQTILSNDTDINIQYRSVRDGYGLQFHDRYIALKYKLNRARVWALGASINAIGKNHSTIQIVQTPELIISLFDKIWGNTNHPDCIIFDNTRR